MVVLTSSSALMEQRHPKKRAVKIAGAFSCWRRFPRVEQGVEFYSDGTIILRLSI